MLYKREWLECQGFVGFVPVRLLLDDLSLAPNLQELINIIPQTGGVYVVYREDIAAPEFLPENVGGHYNGRSPTVEQNILSQNWVERAQTLYIGQGTNLWRRICQLINFANGQRVAHWGGRLLWQVADYKRFLVAWKPFTVNDVQTPLELERTYLLQFRAHYGRLPFANLRL